MAQPGLEDSPWAGVSERGGSERASAGPPSLHNRLTPTMQAGARPPPSTAEQGLRVLGCRPSVTLRAPDGWAPVRSFCKWRLCIPPELRGVGEGPLTACPQERHRVPAPRGSAPPCVTWEAPASRAAAVPGPEQGLSEAGSLPPCPSRLECPPRQHLFFQELICPSEMSINHLSRAWHAVGAQ